MNEKIEQYKALVDKVGKTGIALMGLFNMLADENRVVEDVRVEEILYALDISYSTYLKYMLLLEDADIVTRTMDKGDNNRQYKGNSYTIKGV